MDFPTSLAQFFTFVGTAGAIGAVLSWIAGNWKFFQSRSAQGKMLILFVISLVMGFASHFAVKYIPAGIVTDAEPYYQIVINSIVILMASQVYHNIVDKPGTVKPGPNG